MTWRSRIEPKVPFHDPGRYLQAFSFFMFVLFSKLKKQTNNPSSNMSLRSRLNSISLALLRSRTDPSSALTKRRLKPSKPGTAMH